MQVNDAILQKGAFLFGAEPPALRSLGGSDGAVYEYQGDEIQSILKFVPTQPERIQIAREKWEFVDYLARHGVSVCQPILSRNSQLLEVVQDGEAAWLVSSTVKAAGEHVNWGNVGEYADAVFEEWGRVMGQMHALTQTYTGGQHIESWREECQSFSRWSSDDPAIHAKWDALIPDLAALPETPDGYGLIHNDLHPHNFLVNIGDGRLHITVIDFECCVHHWFITDIAIALFFVAVGWVRVSDKEMPHDAFVQRFWDRFVAGYRQENMLDPAWLKHLPTLLKHHQILLYIVFSHEWQEHNEWQARTLDDWRRKILGDVPVLDVEPWRK
ncbi:MAG: phosphotransferase [Anaerolineae bacterium]|nr:phosphotransferase [Anaerolineae bacterium]